MCASANMAICAIEMTKLEVNGNLVMLQPRSSQHFSDNDDFIIKYEDVQSSIISPSFIIFHHYLERDVDVAHYTTTNDLSNAEIKMFQ